MKSRTNIKRFLVDWAAVLALLVCFIAFTVYKGNSFMSTSNMVNILRAMAINTVFGIAATITMAPDGFDMSAGTLAAVLLMCLCLRISGWDSRWECQFLSVFWLLWLCTS